jgi:alpha-beta hydrolase superfamily lysophospholipase
MSKLLGLLRIFIALGIAYVIVGALIWFNQEKLIFPGSMQKFKTWTVPEGIQSEFIPSEAGITLERWYAPASGKEKGVAIFFNGNGGILPYSAWFQKALASSGYSNYAIDYRGYGRSSGEPSESSFYTDAQTLLQHIRSRHDLTKTPLVIWGASLGSGPATYLAQQNKPAAVPQNIDNYYID